VNPFADPVMRALPITTAWLLIFVALIPDTTFGNEPVKPRRARVLFLVRTDCPKCDDELQRLQKPGGIFETMTSVGWKIGTTPDVHVQIVNEETLPEFVKSLNPTDYPAVAGIDGEEVTRYFKTGCTTPLDAWTFGWLLTGKNERPHEPVPEPVRVATTGSYRLRGNHWSVDGDWNPSKPTVLAHLRSPNHGASAAGYGTIENWSLEELRSLHDDLHEREGGLASGVGYAGATAARGPAKPAYMIPKALR
jgi:hypothetical protein